MQKNVNSKIRLKPGHIFKYQVSKTHHAYGQYYAENKNGPIVRIFDVLTKDDIEPQEIVKYKLMFPPIFAGLHAAIKEGVWEIVGFQEIKNFKEPKFKWSMRNPEGTLGSWFLIEGEKTSKIGDKLPDKYKDLEWSSVWSAYDVNKRIKNKGKIPYEAWK